MTRRRRRSSPNAAELWPRTVDRNTPSLGPLDDITMLVHYGALERTEAEYRVLLEAAGFTLERVMPTQAALSIIEGIPA
jgi:hypothetical protein